MRKVSKIVHKHVTILGIAVTSNPKVEVLSLIEKKLLKLDKNSLKQSPLFIVTPNPEQLVRAQKDKEFSKILNSADFSLPDAVGMVQAAKYLSLGSPKLKAVRLPVSFGQGLVVGTATLLRKRWLESELQVIKGREFFYDLLRKANDRKWRVFLVGGMDGVAEKASLILGKEYKRVNFDYDTGPMLNEEGFPLTEKGRKSEELVLQKIDKFRPHLLFVAFGAPKQEKWMYRLRTKLNVGAMMVVGRTFDYVAGEMKAPPLFLAKNFEWLWTLVKYPKRVKRITVAFPRFPLEVYLHKLRQN